MQNKFETFDKIHLIAFICRFLLLFFLAALAEEFDVVAAVVESILNQIFQHFLGEVHVVLEVEESNFWLNHPEFCKVTRSV